MPRIEVVEEARDNNMDHSHRVKRRLLVLCVLTVVPYSIASAAAVRVADDA
jgi:hypothetical protein